MDNLLSYESQNPQMVVLNKLRNATKTAALVYLILNTADQICRSSELSPLRIFPYIATFSISLRLRYTLPSIFFLVHTMSVTPRCPEFGQYIYVLHFLQVLSF